MVLREYFENTTRIKGFQNFQFAKFNYAWKKKIETKILSMWEFLREWSRFLFCVYFRENQGNNFMWRVYFCIEVKYII